MLQIPTTYQSRKQVNDLADGLCQTKKLDQNLTQQQSIWPHFAQKKPRLCLSKINALTSDFIFQRTLLQVNAQNVHWSHCPQGLVKLQACFSSEICTWNMRHWCPRYSIRPLLKPCTVLSAERFSIPRKKTHNLDKLGRSLLEEQVRIKRRLPYFLVNCKSLCSTLLLVHSKKVDALFSAKCKLACDTAGMCGLHDVISDFSVASLQLKNSSHNCHCLWLSVGWFQVFWFFVFVFCFLFFWVFFLGQCILVPFGFMAMWPLWPMQCLKSESSQRFQHCKLWGYIRSKKRCWLTFRYFCVYSFAARRHQTGSGKLLVIAGESQSVKPIAVMSAPDPFRSAAASLRECQKIDSNANWFFILKNRKKLKIEDKC